MKGEIKTAGIEIEFESDIVDKKVISANCLELKLRTKIRIKGWIKWALELLSRQA
jgi:hypothetical protein